MSRLKISLKPVTTLQNRTPPQKNRASQRQRMELVTLNLPQKKSCKISAARNLMQVRFWELSAGNNVVDKPVSLSVLGSHEVIAFGILHDLIARLTSMAAENIVADFAEA